MYPNPGTPPSSSVLLSYAESQANRYRGLGPLDQVCACRHTYIYTWLLIMIV